MTHIKCPSCGGNEHYEGYGLAVGGIGAYTICACGEILERTPDPAGSALNPPISKEWCLKMAQNEDGAEVGAGLTALDPLFEDLPDKRRMK